MKVFNVPHLSLVLYDPRDAEDPATFLGSIEMNGDPPPLFTVSLRHLGQTEHRLWIFPSVSWPPQFLLHAIK